MRSLGTDTRPAKEAPSCVDEIITVDPSPDMTGENLVRELMENREDLGVVEAVIGNDGHVVVTVYSFEMTKWALEQAGLLPQLVALLPA